MLIRQLVLFGGFILILALLIFVIDGCRDSARESALKDYNRDVASIVRDSDSQVGKPFFDLLRNPSQGDLSTLIAGYKVQAESQYQQAKRIDTPGDMAAAQRSFLITMEMRRDGLQSIADRIRTALSSDAEAADKAIEEIAGAMQLFLSSDVIYTLARAAADRVDAARRRRRRPAAPARPRSCRASSGSTRASSPTRSASSSPPGGGTNGREPAPGLHGTGIDSVQVGDQTLTPDAANRIAYGADTEFTVNFTNQGENDEIDIVVVLRIEGGPGAAAGAEERRLGAGRRGRVGHARARHAAAAGHAGHDHRRRSSRCPARRRRTTTRPSTTRRSSASSAAALVS